MPSIRITVLADNSLHRPGLSKEHGLCLALDMPGRRTWLLDSGASGVFLDNARALNFDLSSLQGVVLSHGHCDHSGGLLHLHQQAGYFGPVFGHPHVLLDRYKPQQDGAKSIGMPPSSRASIEDRLIPLSGTWRLAPGMTFVSAIPRHPDHYQATQGFFLDVQETVPDAVLDDAVLAVDTKLGTVLLVGCSHSGIANILDACKRELGVSSFHALIGGLHLHDAPDQAIEETAAALAACGITAIHAGHCTGENAFARFKKLLGDRVQPLGAGLSLEFPSP